MVSFPFQYRSFRSKFGIKATLAIASALFPFQAWDNGDAFETETTPDRTSPVSAFVPPESHARGECRQYQECAFRKRRQMRSVMAETDGFTTLVQQKLQSCGFDVRHHGQGSFRYAVRYAVTKQSLSTT